MPKFDGAEGLGFRPGGCAPRFRSLMRFHTNGSYSKVAGDRAQTLVLDAMTSTELGSPELHGRTNATTR